LVPIQSPETSASAGDTFTIVSCSKYCVCDSRANALVSATVRYSMTVIPASAGETSADTSRATSPFEMVRIEVFPVQSSQVILTA